MTSMRQLSNLANVLNIWKILSPVYFKSGYAKNVRYLSSSSPATNLKKDEALTLDLITLTDRCAERLKKVAGQNECLKIIVDSGGCSGFEYKFDLIGCDKLEKDDRIFEKNGAKVAVDDLSLNFMRGATIDFEEELIKSAFRVVNNPKAAKGCSCGASFALKPDK